MMLSWSVGEQRPLDLNGPRNDFRPFEPAWLEQPLVALFADAAARYPEHVACEDVADRLTFAATLAASRRLAVSIDAKVPRGAAVGVLLPNEACYAAAVLACLGAAHTCVLIDRNYPQDRVAAIVRDAGLAAVILRRADVEAGYLLPAGVQVLAIDDALADGPVLPDFAGTPAGIDAPAFVVYTSGSTGSPKGIVLSQRAVLHRAFELVNAAHLRPQDKVLSLASPGTIAGLQQIFEITLMGATLVKLDLQRLALGRVLREVAARKITMMFSTPAVWRSVAAIAEAKQALQSLRCVQSSGDTMLRLDYERLRAVLAADCVVLSVYGATEAPALLQWFVDSPPQDEARLPAGYPLSGSDFVVVDDQGQAVAPGAEGELVIRSPFTSLGVWDSGRIGPGPFETDPAKAGYQIYRTGDLVRQRPDGLFMVLGRRDRQIKILGNRIELAEVETALRQLPMVRDVAVIARPAKADQAGAEPSLFAFVAPVSRSGSDVGVAALTEQIHRACADRLHAAMRPQRVFIVDDLPLLPGRKIDEAALLALANDRAVAGSLEPAATSDSSAWVESAWRAALGRAPPAGDVAFDEAGGDSLRLLQVVFLLEQAIGRGLPSERFHGRLTARQMARSLDDCLAANASAEDGKPVVFMIPPGMGSQLLAAFCRGCASDLAVRLVRFMDVAEPGAHFEDLAASVVRTIVASATPGPVVLAGYSDGGDVAYAAARQLRTLGREVALLCIFDTDCSGTQPAQRSTGPAEAGPERPRGFGLRLSRLTLPALLDGLLPDARFRRPWLRKSARWVLGRPLPVPQRASFAIRLRLAMGLVNQLHLEWLEGEAFTQLAIPTVLFHSQEPRPGTPGDLGWSPRTSDLVIVPVVGDHLSMLAEDRSGPLREEFIRRVREGWATVRHAVEPAGSRQ